MIHRASLPPFTRRDALKKFATGFGMAGFASLAAAESVGNPWTPKAPHFAPKAKHVIVIFLQGGLSQIDSFDYKPLLDKYDGKPLPYETPLQLQAIWTERDRSQRAVSAYGRSNR